MHLEWVELRDFRNHQATKLTLADGLSTVVGANGEGKTNLLEGIAFLLTLTSPRTSSDQPLVRHGAEAAYVRGEVATEEGTHLIEIEINANGANRLQVDRSPVRRKRDLRRRVRAVFFGPDDLPIVHGDPGARRRFLDEAVVGLWPNAETPIRAYEKVLRQRNRLLKDWQGAGAPRDLPVWDAELIEHGVKVTHNRARAVAALARGADAGFSALAGYGLEITYAPSLPGGESSCEAPTESVLPELTDMFRERLNARLGDELQRRTTLVGPHRDDLTLSVRDLTARAFASHGESWAAALSLRTGLADALEREVGEPPVRLYDDPFAALDPKRRQALGASLAAAGGQTILATPDEHDVPEGAAVIRVHDGELV